MPRAKCSPCRKPTETERVGTRSFGKRENISLPRKYPRGGAGLSPSIGRAAQTDEMFDNGGNLTRLVKSRGMSRSSPMNRIFPLSSYGELQVGLNLSLPSPQRRDSFPRKTRY